MKKGIVIAIILVACGGGIFYLFQNNHAQAPVLENSGNQTSNPTQTNPQNSDQKPAENSPSGQTNTINNTSTPDHNGGQFSAGEGEPMAPNIQVVEVDYDGTQYAPSTVNIKVNDWVFFKNKSNTEFWPASNPHPVHSDYPEFDSKKAISAGGEYKFQFTKAGNWRFHDHLNPRVGGVINVTK